MWNAMIKTSLGNIMARVIRLNGRDQIVRADIPLTGLEGTFWTRDLELQGGAVRAGDSKLDYMVRSTRRIDEIVLEGSLT